VGSTSSCSYFDVPLERFNGRNICADRRIPSCWYGCQIPSLPPLQFYVTCRRDGLRSVLHGHIFQRRGQQTAGSSSAKSAMNETLGLLREIVADNVRLGDAVTHLSARLERNEAMVQKTAGDVLEVRALLEAPAPGPPDERHSCFMTGLASSPHEPPVAPFPRKHVRAMVENLHRLPADGAPQQERDPALSPRVYTIEACRHCPYRGSPARVAASGMHHEAPCPLARARCVNTSPARARADSPA